MRHSLDDDRSSEWRILSLLYKLVIERSGYYIRVRNLAALVSTGG